MSIVTLLNIFNCYSSIFPMFPTTKNEETVSWLHVKFGIKTARIDTRRLFTVQKRKLTLMENGL